MEVVLNISLLIVGVALGCMATWLLLRARSDAAVARTQSESQSQFAALNERYQGEVAVSQDLRRQLEDAQRELTASRLEVQDVRTREAELKTTLQQERRQIAEKQQLLDEARTKLGDAFSALAAESLSKNNKSFLELAKTNLEKFQSQAESDLQKRQTAIDELLKPVRESLAQVDKKIGEVEKSRLEAYTQLTTQVQSLATTHQQLRQQTSNLVTALRRSEVRGRWGEIQLRRIVELAGMTNHCDFFEQQHVEMDGRAQRPDLVVRLPGQKSIIVDSKVPLAAYLEAAEADDHEDRQQQLTRHARHVRDHVSKLSKKQYHAQLDESPEFVVLFIPIEACLSAALLTDPQLLEFGAEMDVIIATPTTLISLLRAVHAGWRQEQLAENAKKISDLGKELYDRLATMGEHFAKLGKSLERATESYNKVVSSLEQRVLPSARKFEELGVTSSKKDVARPLGIERTTRHLAAPEFAEIEENPFG